MSRILNLANPDDRQYINHILNFFKPHVKLVSIIKHENRPIFNIRLIGPYLRAKSIGYDHPYPIIMRTIKNRRN